ncbi:5,6-dimethylbenzimidazole synthase [uncultured Gammaproteobacteria bacterium]
MSLKSEDRPESASGTVADERWLRVFPPGDVMETHTFSDEHRAGLYQAIFNRRDVRGQFKPDPVAPEVLSRVLTAAHFAPSVGFMQPWNFIVISDAAIKRRVHDDFLVANAEAAERFDDDRAQSYRGFKLEGIMEAPVNICVTCDRDRAGPVVIGRTHIPVMDLYSSVCAVQNLWLAARAEGLGVGWVSILHTRVLREILGLPPRVAPVAYLCLGKVTDFKSEPELATAGWRPRLDLAELIHFDRWQGPAGHDDGTLLDQVRACQERAAAGGMLD